MQLRRIGRPVYLDYAASTPVAPSVAETMAAHLASAESFANASAASHSFGAAAAAIAHAARLELAEFLQARAEQIIFTSGATEANNLAILGAMAFSDVTAGHIVTSQTEHPAVLAPMAVLEQRGLRVTRLAPRADGRIAAADVAEALTDDTRLAAFMLVNNEIGAINPIEEIAAVCQQRGVPLHVDAAQAIGRVDVAAKTAAVTSVAISAHKFYGPKGVGALLHRAPVAAPLDPLTFGGGQERGLRPGTLPTHQLIGMAEAIRCCGPAAHARDTAHITALSERLCGGLGNISGVSFNGGREHAVPGIVNIRVADVHGESLLAALAPLAVAQGSACSSARAAPSSVLRALGLSDREAEQSLRISFGRFTTTDEIDLAIEQIQNATSYLRRAAGR